MNTPVITTVAAQTTTAAASPTSVLVTRQTVEKSSVEIPVVSCSPSRSVVTSSSAKVMPVFYIQSSSSGPVRVGPPNGTTAASTAGSSTIQQKLPTAPRLVAGAHPVKQPTQHLVIQQAGGKQYAYVGTIIKPHGNKELLLSAGVLPKLAPAPAPPSPAVNVAANQPPTPIQVTGPGNTASNKMTSLLVTLPPGAQHVPSKPGMINLKISNGQIHTDNKGCITVLRDSGKVLPTTPTLQPATVKPNGLLIPEVTSNTLTLTPVSSEAHTQSVPIVSQQPVILPAPPVLQPQQPRPESLVQQRQRVQQQQPQQPQQLQQQQHQQQQQQQKPQQLQILQHHPQKQQQQLLQVEPEQQQIFQQQQKMKQEQQQQKLKLEQQQKLKLEQQQKLKQEQQLLKLKQEQQQQLQKLKQEQQQQQQHQLMPSSCAIAVVPTTGTATVITVPTVVSSPNGTLSVVPKIKEDGARVSTVVTTIPTTIVTSVATVGNSSFTTVPAALRVKDDSACTVTVTAAAVPGTTAVITVPVSVSPSPPSASGAPKMMEDSMRTSVLATSTTTSPLITIAPAVAAPHATVSVVPKVKEDSVRTTSVVTTAGTTIISIPSAANLSPATVCATAKTKEDSIRNTQDLNRCLQEAVDSFSPPHVQNDEVTLIKVIKPDGSDASPRPAQLPPEDDVKIELVKQDVTVRPSQTTDIDSDDFDPMKVLEWKNGVGTLPGSDLKFRMNEFGIMEMIDEDDCEKLKQDCKSVSEVQERKGPEKTSTSNECSSLLKAVDKREEKHSGRTPSSQQQIARPPKKENPSGGNSGQGTDGGSSSSGTDEIFCCEGCGCYGLSTEFVSSRFCSDLCASNFANRRAQQSKRERDLLLLRLRRRKKRLLQLMQQQQSQNYARHRLRPMARDRQLLQHLQQHHYARAVQSGMVSSTAKDNCEIEISTQPVAKSDETADEVSDDKTTVSWLSSKKGFLWPKYLEHCKGKQAPQKLFRDPFPYMKNGFKVGMKLEGIDPEHPSYFCVLTVSDVQGYRIRLHFDGYPDNHDFWVNADSVDIFPAGWCEKNNHKLHPPKGYSQASFNWNAYLKQCHAQAAPRNLFANKPGNAVCPSGFRIGMKLEAVDRQNKNSVCVATVADIVDNRILVHFDGRDEAFDYWADPSSPYIHPVGWCEEHNRQLTPPKTYRFSQQFSWQQYLRDTKSVPAPARAFKQRPPSGFRPGMHLECVDKRVPQLIRVATVSAVRGHQLRIEFDGWPREYGYWVDDDSPDLHPVGWCQKTGHPLEPPLVPEETGSNSECPILGCNGVGHIKGPKFAMHISAEFCPYAPGNFQCTDHIPDRLSEKVSGAETQPELCSPEKTKVQELPHKNPVGRPAKRRRIESCEEPKPLIVVQEEEEPAAKKNRHFLEESARLSTALSDTGVKDCEDLGNGSTVSERSASPNPLAFASSSQKDSDITQLELEVRNSVRNPGYEPQPPVGPIPWTQHTQYLNTFLAAVPRPPELVSHWTCDEVSTFLRSIPGCANAINAFAEQEVDGDALILMSQEDLVKAGGLKLGPAVKLYNCVVLLRQLKGEAEGKTMS